MELLLGLLTASAIAGGLVLRFWHQQDRVARLRDRTRLKGIESQLATMRAALRIQLAEHAAREQMHSDDLFANPIIHEEPEQWQR
jgi:predicted membrane-bound spermidine synthase